MEPDVVPDRLEDKINYKIILLIIFVTVSFQGSLFFLQSDEDRNQIIYAVSIINPAFASVSCFIVVREYGSSKTFGRAYLSLGCGFLSIAIAEAVYFIYEEILQLDPYPSIADVFFFALYPFILGHLIISIRFFKPKMSAKEFFWMPIIPIMIISAYITLSFDQMQEASFDFYYGIIFTSLPAIVLPFAILGAKTFKGGMIGTAWLILVFAIIALTIGDVWYYYLEIFGEYDLLHPVNIFWYAGYWIIVYALYKHKKSI
ncbi:MAG: histidine kinase [Candidatus Nitrosotenuis sp.]